VELGPEGYRGPRGRRNGWSSIGFLTHPPSLGSFGLVWFSTHVPSAGGGIQVEIGPPGLYLRGSPSSETACSVGLSSSVLFRLLLILLSRRIKGSRIGFVPEGLRTDGLRVIETARYSSSVVHELANDGSIVLAFLTFIYFLGRRYSQVTVTGSYPILEPLRRVFLTWISEFLIGRLSMSVSHLRPKLALNPETSKKE
jgi:hypothetical protein